MVNWKVSNDAKYSYIPLANMAVALYDFIAYYIILIL